MKKKIVILGSTGSIGKNTINVIRKNKKAFDIVLLSTNRNILTVIKQAKEFKVKDIIINDIKKFNEAKLKFKKTKFKFHNSFLSLKKILKKKNVYYSMIAITGMDGLKPTLQIIELSKNIAIANKESLICGWNLIDKRLKQHKTNFIPIDSEHYSIFSLLKHQKISDVEKIFITASGGPFINYPIKRFDRITPMQALKHPNWTMGKKISIDSATLMNKVFEVIEAKNIFDISYKKISILTHPKSYVHAIIKFHNGLTKFLIHEPNMKIPIFNSINSVNLKNLPTKPLNFKIINNLSFKKIDDKRFPLIKILKKLPNKNSLYETILITINDYFVYKFLDEKISFKNLNKLIYKYSNLKEFQKFKKISPKKVNEIYNLRNYVSLKLETLGI
jgi:1-deoxy-D-xylulose-5-phosphate reductoisomerase